ncbi:MAG: hypothetical protein Kow0042_09220 [Calditrichia bacterium]
MGEQLKIEQDSEEKDSRLQQIGQQFSEETLRVSARSTLRQGIERFKFEGYANLFRRWIEKPVTLSEGYVVIAPTRFYFLSPDRRFEFPLEDVSCVTTNGHYFEFKIRHQTFYQIEFAEESPLKYQIIFWKWLSRFYQEKGQRIVEFQPQLRLEEPSCNSHPFPLKSLPPIKATWRNRLGTWILRTILRLIFSLWIRVRIEGRENYPEGYSFLIIANHQSIFDPFIILTFLDKEIAFLTKSTSFVGKISRIILRAGRGIPTTRYQTDPTVIFHLNNLLSHGIPVGIFPEGERCWDGVLQPFKYSVVRLLVKLRIPIVPVVLDGSFHFLPRWRHWPSRQKIKLTIYPPFCLVPNLFTCAELKDFLEAQFRYHLENGQEDLKQEISAGNQCSS